MGAFDGPELADRDSASLLVGASPVFTDRFASQVMRSTVDAWNVFVYVIRNPRDAGIPVPQRGLDRGLAVCIQTILTQRFLQKLFGTDADRLWELLTRMKRERAPYEPPGRDPHPQLALALR